MDTFEEFEFKPLTEGLGFNKKAETLKNDIKSTIHTAAAAMNTEPPRSTIFPKTEDRAVTKSFNTPLVEPDRTQPETTRATIETSRSASQSISELMASLPPSLDFLDDKQDLTRVTPSARPQIYQPLAPREQTSQIATGPTVGSVLPPPGTKAGSAMATAAVSAPTLGSPAILGGGISANRAGYAERMFETFNKTAPGQTASEAPATTGELTPVAVNFSAALIDAMVVAGISTILLVCIITITHINLVAMLTNTATDLTTQKNLVFLALAVLQMYMLVSRAFFGSTLGEWAFDTQLGSDEQQRKLYYPAQVLWRSLFITFTGLFALPLLSFAFRRDLGKYISGVQLLRRT